MEAVPHLLHAIIRDTERVGLATQDSRIDTLSVLHVERLTQVVSHCGDFVTFVLPNFCNVTHTDIY